MQLHSHRQVILVLCFLLAPFAVRADDVAVREMVEAEKKFYQTGQEKGTRAAFLAFLADDGIVFRPGPVNGKEAWTKRQENGLDLVWEPTFAVMARSADFGYDTGPSKWRPRKTDEKFSGYAYFVSVWKKQKDGAWKVALDLGTETPELTGKPEPLRTVPLGKEPKAQPDPDRARKTLLEAQQEFAESTKTDSGKAALSVAADDIRVYRDGHFPAVGLASGGGLLTSQSAKLLVEPMGGDMSRSADIAYTYGKYSSVTDANAGKGHYFQIWQKDDAGHWKLVLDWMQALPKE